MRKLKGLLGILLLSSVVLFSCNKEKVSVKNTTSIIEEGSWKVTLFQEDGENETHYFTGYVFVFDSNGTVTATKSSQTQSGTWAVHESSDHVELILSFSEIHPFDELNDDWHVIEQTKSKIQLEDVSGGDGSIDYLTFEKI